MKKHIILYGLTQSGIQMASSLVEAALAHSNPTINLGLYFKTNGDRYLNRDESGNLISLSKPETRASNQPFIQTYRNSQQGIISSFDYSTSHLREPKDELRHRIQLLKEDETDNIYVSSLNALQEVSPDSFLKDENTQVIIIDPSNNIEETAKNYFAAHQTSIWVTPPGVVVNTLREVTFTSHLARQFVKELDLVKAHLKTKSPRVQVVNALELKNPRKFLKSLNLATATTEHDFQEARFDVQWRPSDLPMVNDWIKTLQT